MAHYCHRQLRTTKKINFMSIYVTNQSALNSAEHVQKLTIIPNIYMHTKGEKNCLN